MKRHPRIRKTVKWGGAVLTVLLVVAWVGSSGFMWDAGGLVRVGVRRGGVFAARWNSVTYHLAMRSPTRDFIMGSDGPWDCALRPRLYRYSRNNYQFSWLSIPLWCPALLTGLGTALSWRLDVLARRRAHFKLCSKCHYDRSGLGAAAVCPECGSEPA